MALKVLIKEFLDRCVIIVVEVEISNANKSNLSLSKEFQLMADLSAFINKN